VSSKDPGRAAYLERLAVENCATGFQFRAGDAANFAIGQGDTTVTPLQMARVYAAIANGGTLVTPRVAAGFAAPGGRLEPLAPPATTRVQLPAGTFGFLHDALRGVVDEGTAKEAFRGFPLRQWPVAGKTGTAEVFGKQDTSWFVSYAPANAPRYAAPSWSRRAGPARRPQRPPRGRSTRSCRPCARRSPARSSPAEVGSAGSTQ